jgi:hypothetical protein
MKTPKYICPDKDCNYRGRINGCEHGEPHDKKRSCFLEFRRCPKCVEVKDEDS